jgi:hypothetical protein
MPRASGQETQSRLGRSGLGQASVDRVAQDAPQPRSAQEYEVQLILPEGLRPALRFPSPVVSMAEILSPEIVVAFDTALLLRLILTTQRTASSAQWPTTGTPTSSSAWISA